MPRLCFSDPWWEEGFMVREEALHLADGLSECQRWAASPPGSGRTTGLSGAVLSARGRAAAEPPGWGGHSVGTLQCLRTSQSSGSALDQPWSKRTAAAPLPCCPPGAGGRSGAAHCGCHPRLPRCALPHLTRSRLPSRCHHN